MLSECSIIMGIWCYIRLLELSSQCQISAIYYHNALTEKEKEEKKLRWKRMHSISGQWTKNVHSRPALCNTLIRRARVNCLFFRTCPQLRQPTLFYTQLMLDPSMWAGNFIWRVLRNYGASGGLQRPNGAELLQQCRRLRIALYSSTLTWLVDGRCGWYILYINSLPWQHIWQKHGELWRMRYKKKFTNKKHSWYLM
jgi:hypothetical protein